MFQNNHSCDSEDTHHKIRSGGYAISEESLDISRQTKDLFASKWNSQGSVTIGDIDSVPGHETACMLVMRRKIARPMINTLHSCRKLVVRENGSGAFLLWRLQRITSASILEPISTLLNCSYGNIRQGLVDDPAMREIFNRLLQEAHVFAQSFFPKISLREVYTWVWERMERSRPLTDTDSNLAAGHVTNVEDITGDILRRCKECGFSCEKHEQMIANHSQFHKAQLPAMALTDYVIHVNIGSV
jgi:ketopantoate reductase